MGEKLHGGVSPENPGSQSSHQESSTDVIRVRVGEDFEPFKTLTELPQYDPEQGIDQDMFSVRIDLNGIPGTLTLFPDADPYNDEVKNPTLSVEARFQLRTLDEFRLLEGLRLRLNANRNIRYLNFGENESEITVTKTLSKNHIAEVSADYLYTRSGETGKNFAPRPNSLRQIRTRFIPA